MTKPFPMNAWYAAAWDADVKAALLPRTICGKHVVMYRKADGLMVSCEGMKVQRPCALYFRP
ncbi:hypothetical protein [Bradyrhizobium ottawaense]|uniref:hypothetical protein n=1 Tax=Bradyrhizobium ottawaense TaxID=931866 RepID=UPI003BA25FDD